MKKKSLKKIPLWTKAIFAAGVFILAAGILTLRMGAGKTGEEKMHHKNASVEDQYKEANEMLDSMLNAVAKGTYLSGSGNSYDFDGNGTVKIAESEKKTTGTYTVTHDGNGKDFYTIIVHSSAGTKKFATDEKMEVLTDENKVEFVLQ